jgi:hypothetical protein
MMMGNKSIAERLKVDIKKIVLGRREHACRGVGIGYKKIVAEGIDMNELVEQQSEIE